MTTGLIVANANAILDANRAGGADLIAPASLFVQIHTGDPGAAGTNNISAGDNTRKAITHNAPAGGSMTLSNLPQWVNGGVSENIAGISVWTAASGGTCKYTGSVASTPWAAGQFANLTGCTVSVTPIAA